MDHYVLMCTEAVVAWGMTAVVVTDGVGQAVTACFGWGLVVNERYGSECSLNEGEVRLQKGKVKLKLIFLGLTNF